MTIQQEELLALLTEKIEEFVVGRKVQPNALFISIEHVEILSQVDSEVLYQNLSAIDCLIAVPQSPMLQGYDLPLAALLPVIVTKSQREKSNLLLRKDL